MLQSALRLLRTMLTDNKQLAGELHVERLLVFALIWSFGAFLERPQDRKAFDQLLKSLSNWCVPYNLHVLVLILKQLNITL